jgi:transposase-like protein
MELSTRQIEELSLDSIVTLYRKGYSKVDIAYWKGVSLQYVNELVEYVIG